MNPLGVHNSLTPPNGSATINVLYWWVVCEFWKETGQNCRTARLITQLWVSFIHTLAGCVVIIALNWRMTPAHFMSVLNKVCQLLWMMVNSSQITTISFVAFLLFGRTYSVTALLWAVFTLLCGLMGLVIFAFNKYCDPIKDGEIFSKDQVVKISQNQSFESWNFFAIWQMGWSFNHPLPLCLKKVVKNVILGISNIFIILYNKMVLTIYPAPPNWGYKISKTMLHKSTFK